jgi:hypothetical protein
MIIKN